MSMPALTRDAVSSAMNAGVAMPHLMFHGPPGTGKTTCAWIVASHFFGSKKLMRLNTLALNASDERGIESIRQVVSQFASEKDTISLLFDVSLGNHPMQTFKLVILDECDSLTSDAQAILRRVLEDSAQNCRFVFMCNNISKMIAPLISRCRVITFGRMDDVSMIGCLSRIVHQESLHFIGLDKLVALVDTCRGDARQAINHLSILAKSKNISIEAVYHLARRLSPSQIFDCLQTLLFSDNQKSVLLVEKLMDEDLDVGVLLEDMTTMAIELLEPVQLARWTRKISAIQERLQLGGSTTLALYALVL